MKQNRTLYPVESSDCATDTNFFPSLLLAFEKENLNFLFLNSCHQKYFFNFTTNYTPQTPTTGKYENKKAKISHRINKMRIFNNALCSKFLDL